MLPRYFDFIFVHLRQKVRLRPELSPKFFLSLGPNQARAWPETGPNPNRPEKPGPTNNSARAIQIIG